MGIWNSTLVYVGARTLLAGAMIALLLSPRRRVPRRRPSRLRSLLRRFSPRLRQPGHP